MHLHILGICGTFMGGIALLARALGHRVTGSDANVYPAHEYPTRGGRHRPHGGLCRRRISTRRRTWWWWATP